MGTAVKIEPLTPEIIDNLTVNAPSWSEIIDVSEVVCITGMKRFGKSVLAYFLLDHLAVKYKKPRHCWGIKLPKMSLFPSEYKHFSEIDSIEGFYNGVVSLDEIHMAFSARRALSNSNVTFSKMMTFSGQNNQILLLSTLNNGLIDINTFRICNPVLVYKRVGNLQAASERAALRKYTTKAMENWKKIPKGRKDTPERSLEAQLSYVISDEYIGWMKNPKPEWWTQKVSEMHSTGKLPVINPFDHTGIRNKANNYMDEYMAFIIRKFEKIGGGLVGLNRIKKHYPIERYYIEHVLKDQSIWVK